MYERTLTEWRRSVHPAKQQIEWPLKPIFLRILLETIKPFQTMELNMYAQTIDTAGLQLRAL